MPNELFTSKGFADLLLLQFPACICLTSLICEVCDCLLAFRTNTNGSGLFPAHIIFPLKDCGMSANPKQLHPATPQQPLTLSEVDSAQLIASYEQKVAEQQLKIQKLEEELTEVKEHVRKRRDRQLLDLFKQKYEEESKARQDYVREIAANVSSLLAKFKQVETALQKCMADAQEELDDISLPHSDKSEMALSFSGCFSAIGGADGMGETISLGEVSVGDGAAILHQLLFKADYLDALAQVVAVKCDKYQLEHANMSRLISVAKKEVESELRDCRNELQKEVREKEKLKKLLSLAESERLRWS